MGQFGARLPLPLAGAGSEAFQFVHVQAALNPLGLAVTQGLVLDLD